MFHIVGGVVLVVIAAWVIGIVVTVDDWSRDWTTNVAFVTPESPNPKLRSPLLPDSPEVVAELITQWVAKQSRWELVSRSVSDSGIRLNLTRRTPVFRFVDDIRVDLSHVDGGTLVSAESRSRLGRGDLGQNPRNLRELLVGLQSN
jgi:hypothetical protein